MTPCEPLTHVCPHLRINVQTQQKLSSPLLCTTIFLTPSNTLERFFGGMTIVVCRMNRCWLLLFALFCTCCRKSVVEAKNGLRSLTRQDDDDETTTVLRNEFLHNHRHLSQKKDNVFESRIVGGQVVQDRGRYPYFTIIDIRTNEGLPRLCGGALVYPDVVATAAHCGINAASFLLVVNYTSHLSLSGHEHFRQARNVRPHPRYNEFPHANDIMLIQLNRAVPIPPINLVSTVVPPDTPVTVMGFGQTEAEGFLSDELREVEVQIVNHDDCNDANSYDGLVQQDIMVCAGTELGGKVRMRKKESAESMLLTTTS